MENNAIYSTMVRANRTTYFIDVKEAKNGSKYLSISEHRIDAEEKRQRSTINNGKPKVELNLGQETRLKLTRDKAYVGQNSYGQYYLYGVSENGEEKSFFASEEIHAKILEAGLHSGDEFSLKKVPQQQGRKVIAKLDFAVLSKQPVPLPNGNGNGSHVEDSLRNMLLQCVVDADSIIKSAGIQVSDELQKLATTLFIARSRMN